MKPSYLLTATLFLVPLAALLNGCGGGGGGRTSVSPTPSPTLGPTPTVGARVLVVQLRDSGNNPVDGIVTVSTTVLATTGGSATFNRNVAAGTSLVSVEVDGDITTGSAEVKTSGTTIFTLVVAPRITPVPAATIPGQPF